MTIVVLEYHDVVVTENWDSSGFPGPAAASYKLALRDFTAHLETLAGQPRPTGLTAQAALSSTTDSVLLTFDDGGTSAELIADVLASRGWVAHIFMPTDRIGTTGFLTADSLVRLHNAGHIIGSHSASHPTRMSHLSRVQLREEWQRSVGTLADLLGVNVPVASVPGGYFSRAVAESAAEAGIRVLFTSEPVTAIAEVQSCHVIGRYTLRQGDTAGYVQRLVGRSGLARQAQWIRWNSKKIGKRLGGELYLRYREARFKARASRPLAGPADSGPNERGP